MMLLTIILLAMAMATPATRAEGDDYFAYSDCSDQCKRTNLSCTITETNPQNFPCDCYEDNQACMDRADRGTVCLRLGKPPVGGEAIWGAWSQHNHPTTPTPPGPTPPGPTPPGPTPPGPTPPGPTPPAPNPGPVPPSPHVEGRGLLFWILAAMSMISSAVNLGIGGYAAARWLKRRKERRNDHERLHNPEEEDPFRSVNLNRQDEP